MNISNDDNEKNKGKNTRKVQILIEKTNMYSHFIICSRLSQIYKP